MREWIKKYHDVLFPSICLQANVKGFLHFFIPRAFFFFCQLVATKFMLYPLFFFLLNFVEDENFSSVFGIYLSLSVHVSVQS